MTSVTSNKSPGGSRKPRIALMGEFSAGKSTLANILMRETLSPTQITATQLPPIWYSYGDRNAYAIGMDGGETPLEKDASVSISPDETRAIRIFAQCDILEACDIIDMPGSSDPNISADIWQAMLPFADAVIWCTPATQAWRQSEAAMWEDAPERLRHSSLLLLTRIDKILSDRDQARIIRRVSAEVDGQFHAVLPVSLLGAQLAGNDPEAWAASGMDAVLNTLIDVIAMFDLEPEDGELRFGAMPAPTKGLQSVEELNEVGHITEPTLSEPTDQPNLVPDPEPIGTIPAAGTETIAPRRVILKSTDRSSRPRPRRAAASASLI